MRKVQYDLDQYLWHLRTGMVIDMALDWSNFIREAGDFIKTGTKDDPKKILQLAEKDLLKWLELRDQANKHKARFPNALHEIFDEADTNELDRNVVISFVLQKLKVAIKGASETRDQILDYLKENQGTFLSAGRPTVTLFRLVDAEGNKTNVVVPHASVNESTGANRGGKSLPRYPAFRWTSKFAEAGISSRAMFDEMLEWIKAKEGNMRKPSLIDCSKFIAASAVAPDEDEVEDEVEEEVESDAEAEETNVTWQKVAEASAKKSSAKDRHRN